MNKDKAEKSYSELEEFLRLHGKECFMYDYGHSPVSFQTLENIYGRWYFVILQRNEKLKPFYLCGSKNHFRKRANDLAANLYNRGDYVIYRGDDNALPIIWTMGYVPSLFTVDLSNDELANAIRLDFIRHGQFAYETGDNLIGKLYMTNGMRFIKSEYSRSRYLDFDLTKWILKNRKMSSRI